MANEAVLIFEYSPPIPMTVANTPGIERGTLLNLSDPLTAAAISDSTAAHAGISAEEKIDEDGKLKHSVYRDGVFKVTASGGVTVGEAVVFEVLNTVMAAGAASVHLAGVALETATNGETFLMDLKPTHNIIT